LVLTVTTGDSEMGRRSPQPFRVAGKGWRIPGARKLSGDLYEKKFRMVTIGRALVCRCPCRETVGCLRLSPCWSANGTVFQNADGMFSEKGCAG